MENEYEVLCDDGETVVIEAETVAFAIMDAIDRGYKVVSAGYAS